MKKLIIAITALSLLSSCINEKETVPPSVIIVKPINGSEKYYAEVLHKNMFEVGDTLRITYSQMPKHELAYPNLAGYSYVSVVLISK